MNILADRLLITECNVMLDYQFILYTYVLDKIYKQPAYTIPYRKFLKKCISSRKL